ncbi:hypothetical protein Dimus_014374 [Dionaea muscipula]
MVNVKRFDFYVKNIFIRLPCSVRLQRSLVYSDCSAPRTTTIVAVSAFYVGNNTHMGNAISNAAGSFGTVVGNTLAAPFKSVFTKTCDNICSGAWDFFCFIEHFCISDLMKLLLIFSLCYIALLFFYLLFKLGICQCIVKSLFKMCWAVCETYWFTLRDVACFCWHKIRNSKRVYRGRRGRRFRDVELGYNSSEDSSPHASNISALARKRKPSSSRGRKMNSLTPSSHPLRKGSSRNQGYRGRLKSRRVSLQLRGRSRKSSKHLQVRNLSKRRRKRAILKRPRLR